MDVFVTRGSQRFVWDSDKAAANVAKHGISFDRAIEVFLDPFHYLLDASVPDEQRQAAMGVDFERRFLFVVHLEREGILTRIISARAAMKSERRVYEESQ